MFTHPCLYAGDFNCPHVDWGYNTNSADGDCLLAWASSNNLSLLHDPKDKSSFHSGRWNTCTNLDLAFTTVGSDSRLPYRRVSEKFPRSQQRPSLITPTRLSLPVPGRPVKRWNFHKANWSHYNSFTNKLARNMPSPDSTNVDQAYQDLCNSISKAAKKAIPCGRRNTYIPCWDAKCEGLYLTFLQSPAGDQSSRAATALTLLWYHGVNIAPGLFDRLNIPNFEIISFHLALYFLCRLLSTVSIHLILISMLPFL